MKVVALPAQLCFYILFYYLAERFVEILSFPLPANIVGMIGLLALLSLNLLPVKLVRAGSTFLLSEMLLFFVPAVVAIVNYFSLMSDYGIKIMTVIFVSTIMVLSFTALVVQKLYALEMRGEK